MKKLLSLMLALCMVLSCVPALAEALPTTYVEATGTVSGALDARGHFYTDYSTAAWALFTGAPHYGPTPKSSGYTGTEKDVIAFMVGVTEAPYLTGDYQYIKCTLD